MLGNTKRESTTVTDRNQNRYTSLFVNGCLADEGRGKGSVSPDDRRVVFSRRKEQRVGSQHGTLFQRTLNPVTTYMNRKRTLSISILSVLVASLIPSFAMTAFANPPIKIILDTDFGDDGDDLAALAVLHHFADLGEAEILAVGQSNSRWDAPGAIDVINTYYGRPDIPIGIVDHKTHEGDQYSSFLVKNYEFDLDLTNVSSASTSTDGRWLRLLTEREVCGVGFKSNMRDLLKSKPDDISPLSGVELVRKK